MRRLVLAVLLVIAVVTSAVASDVVYVTLPLGGRCLVSQDLSVMENIGNLAADGHKSAFNKAVQNGLRRGHLAVLPKGTKCFVIDPNVKGAWMLLRREHELIPFYNVSAPVGQNLREKVVSCPKGVLLWTPEPGGGVCMSVQLTTVEGKQRKKFTANQRLEI